MNKRMFQVTIAILSLLPILNGLMGIFRGPAFLFETGLPTASLDNQFRYLSGLYLGLGILILSIIPRIEEKKEYVRAILGVVFLGGVGRLFSWFLVGAPHIGMQVGVGIELLCPLLILWHNTFAVKKAA